MSVAPFAAAFEALAKEHGRDKVHALRQQAFARFR